MNRAVQRLEHAIILIERDRERLRKEISALESELAGKVEDIQSLDSVEADYRQALDVLRRSK